MPTIVTIPNLGDVEFDDSLSEQQITDAINTRILKRQPAPQATETITAQQAPTSHGTSASWDAPSALPDQFANLGASAMAGLTRGIGQVATAAARIPDAFIPSAKITTPEVRERFALAPATKQYWDEIANSYENIKKATNGNDFASQVAEMVGGLGAPVLASAIPGGTIAAFAAQGYEGSRDQAEKYLRENAPSLSDEQINDAAHKVGLLAGAVTGALTKYTHLIPGLNKLSGEGIDKWISEAATKQLVGIPAKAALVNVAKAGVGAALQQAAFSAGEMAVAKPTYEPNLTLAEAGQRLVQSAAAGGIVGAGLRGFTESRRRVALGSAGGAEGAAVPQNEPSVAGGTEVGGVEPAAPSAPPEVPAISPTPAVDPASLVGRVFQYAPGKIARIVRADDIGFSITSPDGIRSSTYHEINSHPQDVFDRTQALPEMPKPAAEAAQPEIPSATTELQRQQGGLPPERASGIQGGETVEAGHRGGLLSPEERQAKEAETVAAQTPMITPESAESIRLKLQENMQGRTVGLLPSELDARSAHLEMVLGKPSPTWRQLIDAGLLEPTAPAAPVRPGELGFRVRQTPLSETKPAEGPPTQPKLETSPAPTTPERPANVPTTSSIPPAEPLAKRGGAKGKAEAGKTKPITERGLSKAVTEAFARPWDLIDELEANLGGKLSLPIAREWLGPDFKPIGRLRKVFSNERTAYGPDVGAQAVSGMKSFENDEAFLRALEDAARARKGFRETRATERKATEQAATQREDFEKQVVRGVKGAERVPVHDLLEGDKFAVKGQKFTVDKLEIDPDGRLLSLTVKDGPRFGVQSLSPDYAEFIHVDKNSYKPVGVSFLPPESNAPVEAPVAQPPATPPEGFTLNAPESVEQQKARLATEQAKQAEQRAKEELARKAATPLTGTTGNLGQGDLLNAPEELFAPPTPKPAEMPKPFGSQNKIVTTDRAELLKQRIKDKLRQTSAGVDPTIFSDAVQLGAYYIEAGFHRFEDWSAKMLEDFGESLRNHLRSIYETARVTIESPSGQSRSGQPAGLQPGLKPPGERIILARGDLTKPADESVIPQELAPHLDPHQKQGVAKALNSLNERSGFLLADGTGVGKTRQALSVAHSYAKDGNKVIIVTKAETIKPDWKTKAFGGSYAADGAQMGVKAKLARDGVIAPGEIGITTYQNLSDVAHNTDPNTVLIFDESHALKNDSQQARHGLLAIAKAKSVMFMSATPADKAMHIHYLARMGILEGKSIGQALQDLGMSLVTMDKMVNENGKWIKRTLTFWAEDQKVTDQERNVRLNALFNRMTEKGAMLKREISLDGVHVQVMQLALPPEAHETMGKILQFFDAQHVDDLRGLKKAIVLGHQRRQQEPYKIPSTVMLTQRELANGRQVVIFVSRVNASEVGKWVKVPGMGGMESERIREVLMSSEGTTKSMRAALEDAGIHDIAEIHGNADQNSLDAMADYQSGRKRVVIATIESGGTGINLDDTLGNRPRSMVVVTAPFDAVGNVQAAGRIWRLKTLSGSNLFYLFGDTDVDAWNADIIGSKMSTLGAVVEGQVRRLDVGNPDLVTIDDYHGKGMAPEPVATAQRATLPSLDWKPFTTKAGAQKFVAPATPDFWKWWRASGEANNPEGLRVSKYQDKWQVWSDKPLAVGTAEPMTLKEDVQMELANITRQVQKGEPVTYGKEPEQPRSVQSGAPEPVAGARQTTVQARPFTVEQSAKIADAIRQRVENLQAERAKIDAQAAQWGETTNTGRSLRTQSAYLGGKIEVLRDSFENFVRRDIISRLEAKKLKPGDKSLSAILPGLDPETARSVWNTGLDIAIQAIKAGRAVRYAIDKAVEHIRIALKGAKFDENAVRLELARDTSEALMGRREATPPPLPPTAALETKPPISQKQWVRSEEPTIPHNATEKAVLDSRPFKDTAQLADELGIITPKEDESGVPTKVGDVYDQVLSRPGLNNAVREASVENASNALGEAGLAAVRHADGLFRLADESASQEDSGQRLVPILEREIQAARADNRPERIANLLNSTVVHLARDKNKAFSQPLKNKLYALAQGERSTFGRALGSLAMWGKVLAYVAQNPDLHLNRLYSRFVGGAQVEPIIEKIEKVSREAVKPEDIKAVVDAAGAPSNTGEIVTKILKTPRFSAKSIQGEIASALVKELGMSPDEAAAMAGRIYKALEGTEQAPGTLRKARQTALEKVQAELGPEQKKVFKKGKTLWQKIERAVRAGLFDPGPILQDMAKANGWTVPSEAQKAQLKAWVEKENYLRTPTVRQINEANGDVVKATIAAEKGTETERLKLIKDIQANWSRWSMPISWNPKTWLNPQIARNNAKAINEFVGANLLFKLGFPVRQFVDVGAVSLPLNAANRSLVHVLERAERTGGFDAATLRDFGSATQEMVTARIASVKTVYRAAERTATGHLDRKVLERMTHSIGIFERMRVKADELEKAGNVTAAYAIRLATLLQAGYRAAATFDSLQAVGLEWQEMRQQLSSDLRAAGKNRAEIATQLDDVFGGLRVDMSEAEAEVRAIKAERGLPIDEKSVQQDAWGLVKSRAYDRMRRATGASTDYQAENEQLRELHSWNLPETGGIGGVIAGTIKAIKTATEKVGVPTGGLFSFGNAMGIAANRMATFSGGGLFGGFGFGDSPWYLGERNIRQRRIEAVEGLAAIGTLIGLAAAGKILIQTRYPKDKDEKEKFIAEGHKLNSVRFINDDGRWLEYPIQMSPFSFIAGPLYMIGGIQQLLTEQKKAQDTLNAEAAKKGLVAGRAKTLETGDVMGVIAQGLYGMLTGGRTASGAIQSFSDYGDFHLNRAVAGFASPYLPTVPAWQEISRMMGIAMDTRTATVLELMVPVPGTNHERVNSLGDTMSNPNALVRVLQVLSGGIGFGSPQDIRDNHAYRQIFNAGYSAPDIGRNKGFDFNGVLRPMTPTEFDTYVAARGRAFKQQLQGISTDGLPQEEAHKLVAKAFHVASSQALQQIGVTAEAPPTANVAIGGGAEPSYESAGGGGAGSSRIGGPVSGRLTTGFGAGFGAMGIGAAGGLGTVRAPAMAEATGGGRIGAGAAAIAAKGIRRAGSRRGGRRLSIAHRGLGGKARSYRIRGLRRR